MGMKFNPSGMRMERGSESGCAAEFFIIPGKDFQGILDTVKHKGIDGFLVFPCQVPQLFGKSEGDQVVFGRKPFVQLIFDPLLIFMVLAMRAAPVTAGVGNISSCTAVMITALGQHLWAMILPALLHGPEGLRNVNRKLTPYDNLILTPLNFKHNSSPLP
jgi:hypothetical protein